ncbi:MAG: undecaprenyldiphospho-muramoylpentapeptide beta-N-acetylglucosaminyltransferase [Deltaproteobacteria bacterium]|nr:undecaprenyldiphospho-muramoylpentapeptide beta-N-acetylglucosaminyltransferase [Deltaproteobacteria bacterium]
MRLLIAGGGTGGHVFPAIAIAEALLEKDKEAAILFVGTRQGLESKILPKFQFSLKCISMRGFKGKSGAQKIFSLLGLPWAVLQSIWIILRFKPDVVLGVGGYASLPVLVAAFMMRKKRAIQEQNFSPGLANRLLFPWVHKIFLSFEGSKQFCKAPDAVVTGNPVRKKMVQVPPEEDQKFSILIFGGSLGAHAINRAMLEALPYLSSLKEHIQIVHQTGKNDLRWVENGYAEQSWATATIVDFIYEMDQALQKAQFVICRSGATTLAEVALCGKACLFIPYPHAANNEQELNAAMFLKQGAARVLLNWKLDGQTLAKEIQWATSHPRELEEMRKKIVTLSYPYAAQAIVQELEGLSSRP